MSQGQAVVPVRHASETPPAVALLREGIDDVLSRRRLIRYLTQADMKKRGSDTLLGNLWWVLDPLLQMLVYIALVAIIGRGLSHPDYPLFIFSAILPWKWFSAVVTDATSSVVRQDRLIRQIAFPKLVLPMATTSAGVVGFVFGLLPLGALLLYYHDRISPQLLWIPVIAGVQFVFTLAMAILVSAANVFFRDLGNAVGHVLRLWWFLSPGLYSLSNVHGLLGEEHSTLATLASLNPFAVLFEAYRAVIYGSPDGAPPSGPPDLVALGWLLLGSIVFAALATIFFKRVEPDFAKLI
jgi:homopolymeric O-antigen transport system permease protein